MKFCTNCGRELSGENKFCPGCGVKIGNDSVAESSSEVKEQKQEVKVEEVKVDNQVAQNVVQTPSVQQPVTSPSVSNNQNKKKPIFIVIIVILAIAIVGLLVLIGIKFVGSSNSGDNGNSGNDPVSIPDPIDDDITGNNNNNNNNNNNTNNNNNNNNNNGNNGNNGGGNTVQTDTYEFSGYKFVIPKGYTTKVSGKYLQLFNYTDKVQFNLQVIKSVSYNSFITSKEEIKNEITSMGYTVNSIQEEQINGTNSLVLICSNQSNNVTFVITALSDYDCLMAAYVNYGSKSDSEIKSVASKLATTATSSSSSFSNNESKNYSSGTVKVPEFSMKN